MHHEKQKFVFQISEAVLRRVEVTFIISDSFSTVPTEAASTGLEFLTAKIEKDDHRVLLTGLILET